MGDHMRAHESLVGNTVLGGDAGGQIQLVFWLVEICAISDGGKEALQISTILDRVAVFQHRPVVEEKDRQNNRGSVAGRNERRESLQLVVRVRYDSVPAN